MKYILILFTFVLSHFCLAQTSQTYYNVSGNVSVFQENVFSFNPEETNYSYWQENCFAFQKIIDEQFALLNKEQFNMQSKPWLEYESDAVLVYPVMLDKAMEKEFLMYQLIRAETSDFSDHFSTMPRADFIQMAVLPGGGGGGGFYKALKRIEKTPEGWLEENKRDVNWTQNESVRKKIFLCRSVRAETLDFSDHFSTMPRADFIQTAFPGGGGGSGLYQIQ